MLVNHLKSAIVERNLVRVLRLILNFSLFMYFFLNDYPHPLHEVKYFTSKTKRRRRQRTRPLPGTKSVWIEQIVRVAE